MNNRNIDYMQEYINLCNSTRRYLNSSMQLLSTQDRRLYSLISHYIFSESDDEDNNESSTRETSVRSNDNTEFIDESKSDDDSGDEIITQNLTRNQRVNLANSNTSTYSRRSGTNRRTTNSTNYSLPRVLQNRLIPSRSIYNSSRRTTLTPLRRTTLIRPSNLNTTSNTNTSNTNTSTRTTTRRTNTLARRDPSYHYPRRNVSNTTRRLSDILYNFYENNPITTFTNLTPVIVRPTREQIENATQRVMYSTIEEPYNVTCPITQLTFGDDEYVTQILHCRHIFTTASLNQWFMSNVRCPVCRYDIREYNPLSEIRNPYRNTNTTTNSSTQNNDASSNDTSANDASSNDTSAGDLYDTSSNINQILETFNENRIRFEENIQNTIENSISNNGLNQDVFIEYTYFFPTSTSSLDNSLNTSNDQSGNILDV